MKCGIQGVPPGRGKLPETTQQTNKKFCPFRGLEVYREEDQHLFFGRDALIQKLIEHLNKDQFLAVLGPSGSEKSSVVQAGLIPILRDQHSLITLLTPQSHPIEELAFALHRVYREAGDQQPTEAIKIRLTEDVNSLYFIAKEITDLGKKKRLIVIIDQFEEIFTQTKDHVEQHQFLNVLLKALESGQCPVSIILTMRSDFVGKCVVHSNLNTYLNDHFFQISPMNSLELKEAILRPVKLACLEIEDALVAQILHDIQGAPNDHP